MSDLRRRIEEAIAGGVDPRLFEQCVWDLLLPVYPGLAPIPGGTDLGRDADVHGLPEQARLVVTTSADVRRNLRNSLRRLDEEGLTAPYIVVATTQSLSGRYIEGLRKLAAGFGVTRLDVYERQSWVGRLYHDPDWRHHLLGLSGEPSALVDVPLELDLSEGMAIPLVGRSLELAALRETEADVLLVGVAGSGKTRLLAELPGVAFVVSSDTVAIADAVRRDRPRSVVLDDAQLRPEVLSGLLELRRQERLAFRIIATSSPQDAVGVGEAMGETRRIDLQLLERADVDAIVRSAGVANFYVRAEILEQAEGRAGWAVALARLAAAGDIPSLRSGAALIAEVERYLAKSGLASVVGVLAAVATLHHVAVEEQPRLRHYLELRRLEFDEQLQKVMRGGLVEIDRRLLTVRPSPLAVALTGRWYFDSDLPRDIRELESAFPDRTEDIYSRVIDAALSGSAGAVSYVEQLMAEGRLAWRHMKRVVLLSSSAAAWASEASDAAPAHLRMEILAAAAKTHASEAAIERLLTLGLTDTRPRHANPDHPLRVIGEIGTRVFPHDLTSFEARSSVLGITERWARDRRSPEAWRAYAEVAVALLSPMVEGSWTDPAKTHQITLTAGFESPSNLRTIAEELWGRVERVLPEMADAAVAELAEALDAWLRVAKGIQGPFGSTPSDDAQAIARRLTRRMRTAFRARATRPGLVARLMAVGSLLDAPFRLPLDPEFAVLIADPIHGDWEANQRRQTLAIKRLVRRWVAEDPVVVTQRLADWVEEAALGRVNLDSSLAFAFAEIARSRADIQAWASAIVGRGLCPYAVTVLMAAVQNAGGEPPWLAEAMRGSCRASAVDAVLRSPLLPTTDAVLAQLRPEDAGLVEWAVRLRKEPDEVCLRLLRHAEEAVRGAAAVGFRVGGMKHGPGLPDEWADDWVRAFLSVRAGRNSPHDEYVLEEVLTGLITSQPAVAEAWVTQALAADADEAVFRRLPYRAKEYLPGLPRDARDRIVRGFEGKHGKRYLLEVLLGDDAEWAGQLLADGAVTPDEVLHGISGRTGASLERFIPVLREAGVPPAQIAVMAQFNVVRIGPESEQFRTLREYFANLTESNEASVAEVGRAGEEIYSAEEERARKEERLERIRGL